MRLRVTLPGILLMLVTISVQSSLFAQSSDCTGKAAQAQLSSVDPVYVDALELARNLIDHGFIVKCVQASKWGNLFVGQEGAALYRTDRGSFDVLFLPKDETFDAVEVVEQRQGTVYLYSFLGTPYSPGRMEGQKTYFIKSGNLLFLVWGDAKLAASIPVSSGAETDRVLNTALVPEQQTTLRVGDSAVLRIPSDHEYSIESPGNVLVPVRRSQIGVIYRAVRPGQQTILLSPHVSEGDCVSCATHHYFITVVPRN